MTSVGREYAHRNASPGGARSLIRRLARAGYRPDRWPGRIVWPVLRSLPSVISSARATKHFTGLSAKSVLVLCVYRKRNAGIVTRMVDGCTTKDIDIRLWALDSPVPDLERYTTGVGPGPRCELLNRLWSESAPTPDWLVVVDDDVELLKSWTIPAMIGAMSMLDVDFAQPSHVPESLHVHAFNNRRPLVAGRSVAAVEVGPLFIVRAPWVDRVVPFPADAGMGLYLEWAWSALADEGCRSAVLDCAPMRHLAAVGADYGAVTLGSPRHLEGADARSLDEFISGSAGYGRLLWPSVGPLGRKGGK